MEAKSVATAAGRAAHLPFTVQPASRRALSRFRWYVRADHRDVIESGDEAHQLQKYQESMANRHKGTLTSTKNKTIKQKHFPGVM
jgi:hypothetical protein